MSIGFSSTLGAGSTDRIVTTDTASPTTQSWSFREWRNGDGGSSLGTIFDKRNSAIPGYFICRNQGSRYEFYASFNGGSSQMTAYWTRPASGEWNCWTITYDSSSTSNLPVVYQNGIAVPVTPFVSPTGTVDTNTDPYCVGNFNVSSYNRAWDGKLAEWAHWGSILTEANAVALASGRSPVGVSPGSLLSYLPLVRSTAGLKGPTTVTGTAVQTHPRILLPKRRQIFLGASAGGGGTTVSGTLGTATASGYTGGVNANRTITGSLGTATASGFTGGVDANRTIAGALGTAVASGFTGTVSNTNDIVIGGTLGIAIASGLLGNVNANHTIASNLGTAVASGLTGTVSNGTSATLDLILKILRNRQELNPATGTFTLYDDDGVTVLYTTNAWADAAGTVPYSGGALRRIDALF